MSDKRRVLVNSKPSREGRFVEIFDAQIQNQSYLLGERPGTGDFACYGQMTMLVITDPTPMQIALDISPRAYAWTEKLEDISGLEVSDATGSTCAIRPTRSPTSSERSAVSTLRSCSGTQRR
jgi:hypothetical protein